MVKKNIPASIRNQLLNKAKERKDNFQFLVERYALERLLYRISLSTYRSKFILKGGMLISLWAAEPYRSTRDADLLSYGENDPEQMVELFREICLIPYEEDGLTFQTDTITHSKIKEDQEYEGIRLKFVGNLDGISIDVQFDIGFGDKVTPGPQAISYPTILSSLAHPQLLIYPRETVVSEKFEAMVKLDLLNSRMKDFYDVWFLCTHFAFQGTVLVQAIQGTFERRGTPLPKSAPVALSSEFTKDASKQGQWRGFLSRMPLKSENKTLAEVVDTLGVFLMPPTLAIVQGKDFERDWTSEDGWS